MKDLSKLLNTDFNLECQNRIYNTTHLGILALQQVIASNQDFFNYNKISSYTGHLLTYAIERQLAMSANNSQLFSVSSMIVNEYGYKASLLQTSNFVCSIGRTKKPNNLLNKSNYKANFAKRNEDCLGNQMCINLSYITSNNQDEPKFISSSKHYAQITYYYSFEINSFLHFNIVIPDSNYKTPLINIDILNNIELNTNTSNQENEITVAKLKDDLIAKLQKKSI